MVPPRTSALERLLGLAVLGEQVAAKTYARMAALREDLAATLLEFAAMEGRHGARFLELAARHGIAPDQAFADRELGYLLEQVREHHQAGDFEALAVLQGFIVECLAIAIYEPFLTVAEQLPGSEDLLRQALADERRHVEWISEHLRGRYAGSPDELLALAQRVNARGVDCVGGTLLNIAGCLGAMGLSGADCAARMMDEYAGLLERVGLSGPVATQSVVALFVPLMRGQPRAG